MVESTALVRELDDARLAVLRDCPQLSVDDIRIDWDPTVLPGGGPENVDPADPQCFVLRLGGTLSTLPVAKGMGHTTVAIASAVQDHLVDERRMLWPQVVDTDGRTTVLDVACEGDTAFWVARGFPRCRVGELLTAAHLV